MWRQPDLLMRQQLMQSEVQILKLTGYDCSDQQKSSDDTD